MLTQEATPAMLEEWKAIWHKYKNKLHPNRKSGNDVVTYLSGKYSLKILHDEKAEQVIVDNVLLNKSFAEKLPKGKQPSAITFIVENDKKSDTLYQEQDRISQGEIFVGVDLVSGFYHVEGSSLLWDELCAFQGLDKKDIQNYFCVAQYVFALEKFGLL